MAEYILSNKSDLIAIADAIRAKTGSSELISFPSEFVSAIEGITAGSGGTNGDGSLFVVENEINIDVTVSVKDDTVPIDEIVCNMTKWSMNTPSQNAYTSITYDDSEKLNVCQYTGVEMFEVIGVPVLLEAGKKYVFSVDFYTPNLLIGDYAEPYAPYIAFLPLSAVSTDADPYSSNYAYTKMALSLSNYTTYTCSYIPESTVAGCAVFVMGSTRDGISTELRLKNINLNITEN